MIPVARGSTRLFPALAWRKVLIIADRDAPICRWPTSEALIDWFAARGAPVETPIHDGDHEPRLAGRQTRARMLTSPPKGH